MDELTMFDYLPNDQAEQFKQKKSTDWKWSFKDYPKEKNGLTVFSCFACGGGSTMGYKLAGCDVIGCVEIDPKMNEIYVKNHHPKHNFCMDLRDFNNLPNEELPQELFDLDILDGSPPCTTFSMAGDREETWGKKKKFRKGQKEQTLDDLSFVFIDTVRKLKPRVVIMENVEGLLLGEAFSYVQRIYRELKDAGYLVNHWLLKGELMGVPQTRHRTFFVAIRKDLGIDPYFLDMTFNYEPVMYKQVKEGKVKRFEEDTKYISLMKKAIPEDRTIAETQLRLGIGSSGFQSVYARPNNILSTIRAKDDQLDLDDMGCISKETLRNASTFPQDYNFLGNSRGRYSFVLGMSVPPVMMKRVVTRLIEQGVFDYKKEAQHD